MITVSLSDRMLSALPSSSPSPEDELIAAEECRGLFRRRPPITPRALGPGSLDRAAAALGRIPEDEARAIVLWFGGVRQRDIAEQVGTTQRGVCHRIRRGLLRVQWITGPHAWFTAHDLRLDLQVSFDADTATLLASVWETTSQSETARRYRLLPQYVHARVLATTTLLDADARLAPRPFRRYAHGFRELARWGTGLLAFRRQGAMACPIEAAT